MEPTLSFITAQDATTITISKTELDTILQTVGISYTPDSADSHESLIWAIVKAAQTSLTQANWNTNASQHVFIEDGFSVGSGTKSGVTDSDFYFQPSVTVTASKAVNIDIAIDDL